MNAPADARGSASNTSIKTLAWTSDGYAIAVGFEKQGLAVWSVYGNLLCSISATDDIFYSRADNDDFG